MKAEDPALATKTSFELAKNKWNRKVDEERFFKNTW